MEEAVSGLWMALSMLSYLILLSKLQMLAFCRAKRKSATPPVPSPSQMAHGHRGDAASRNQASGMASLANISTARRTVSLPSISGRLTSSSVIHTPPLPPLPTGPTPQPPDHVDTSDADRVAQEQQRLADDQKLVEKELDRWILDPLWPKSKPLNLVRFWDVGLILRFFRLNLMCLRRYRTARKNIHSFLK
jgi:hypothetical protein